MQISNLIETLSTFNFFGFAFLLYVVGCLYKRFSQKNNFKRTDLNSDNFSKYEDSWYFYVAWCGGLLWCAIYQTIFFNDIYNSIHSSDSVVSIIILIFLYELFLYGWLHYLYLKPDNHFKSSRSCVICGMISILLIFIFIWVFLDDYQWYHFGVVLLALPSTFALLCIVDSQTYRTKLLKSTTNINSNTINVLKLSNKNINKKKERGNQDN